MWCNPSSTRFQKTTTAARWCGALKRCFLASPLMVTEGQRELTALSFEHRLHRRQELQMQ
ncbi:uncharacterized protein LOC144128233 isoform X6 [Amblyomma americanum]